MAGIDDLAAPRLIVLTGKGTFLQRHCNFNLFAEDVFRQCFRLSGLVALLVLAEEFKVAAIVKDQKTALVRIFPVNLVNTGKPFAQPSAPANHLPEFRFRTHLLEKYQIDALRHIDAGIHHVHRYGNVRFLLCLLEVVDDGLGIGIVTDHPLGECTVILRVQLIESFQNKFCMALILGKDDGFPQAVAPRHFDPPLHQVLQHKINSWLVKHKFIQFCRGDELWHHAVLSKILLIPFLVLVRQFIIGNAFFQKLGFNWIGVIRHQHMILISRRLIVIGIGGHIVFHLEKVVGIAVHVGFGRSGKPHHHGIKILKNSPVLFENTSVALVNDNEIKMRWGKQLPPVLGFGVINSV